MNLALVEFMQLHWALIVKYGPPVVALFFGLLGYSLNIYLRSCAQIYALEKYIDEHKSPVGFAQGAYPVRLRAMINAFKPVSGFRTDYMKFVLYQNLINEIKFYRKLYAIAFPIGFMIVGFGVYLNAWWAY